MSKRFSMKAWKQQQAERAGKVEFGNGSLTADDLQVGDQVVMYASCYIPQDERGTVEKIDAADPFRKLVYFRFPTHVAAYQNGVASTELLMMAANGLRFCEKA